MEKIKEFRAPLLVLLIGCALSMQIFLQLQEREDERLLNEVKSRAGNRIVAIKAGFNHMFETLDHIAIVIRNELVAQQHEDLTSEEFQSLAALTMGPKESVRPCHPC